MRRYIVNIERGKHRLQIEYELDTFISTPAICIGYDNNVRPTEWICQIAILCIILSIRIR